VNPLRRGVLVALASFVMTLVPAHGRTGQGNTNIEEEIASGRSELSRLTRDIREGEARIAALREKARGVESEIAEIEATLESARSLSRAYGDQIARLEEDIQQRSIELDRTRARIEDLRVRLRRHICRIYERGKPAYLDLLLRAEDFAAALRRARYVSAVLGAERSLMRELAGNETRLSVELTTFRERLRELAQVRVDGAKERDRLEALQAERAVARASTRDALAASEASVEALRASARDLDELIRVLEARKEARERAAERERLAAARRERGESANPAAGTADSIGARAPFIADTRFDDQRGRLPWPVMGPILAPFGPSRHAKYGTITYNTGIAIGIREGTPIRAVASGQVEFVEWVRGYGRTVIISHGDGYYSLYAHASRTLVAEGDAVRAGTEIALSGSTDSLHGPCVHFELRRGGETLDPAQWLR
jgi:septal ring factor EnvC (AmiA/AmiB activator)